MRSLGGGLPLLGERCRPFLMQAARWHFCGSGNQVVFVTDGIDEHLGDSALQQVLKKRKNSLACCTDKCIIAHRMPKLRVARKRARNEPESACFLVRPNDVAKYLLPCRE